MNNGERKRKKTHTSKTETDSQIKVLEIEQESSGISLNDASQPSVKKQRHKRKKKLPNSCSEIKEKVSQKVEENSVTGADQGEIIKTKRRRKKRRRGKSMTTNGSESSVNIAQTSSNYPKEPMSNGGVSCNWKKLCQTIGASKTPRSNAADYVPEKLQKPGNLRESKRISSHSKPTEIWFDGVDKELLESSAETRRHGGRKKENVLVKQGSFAGLTNAVAMDCEMVGVGENGTESIVARVSIVNLMGNCIYDKYVKPTEPVTDYRTAVSGIRPSDLEKGEDFKTVQKEVSDILEKRKLIGHAVHNDLKVLFLTHPKRKIRDTSAYKPFRSVSHGNTPSLKKLAEKLLGVKVQEGEHSSVQDAQAAMRLYTMYKIDWENAVKKKEKKRKNKSDVPKPAAAASLKKLGNSPTIKKFSQLKI